MKLNAETNRDAIKNAYHSAPPEPKINTRKKKKTTLHCTETRLWGRGRKQTSGDESRLLENLNTNCQQASPLFRVSDSHSERVWSKMEDRGDRDALISPLF